MATASDLATDWPPPAALHSPLVKIIVGAEDEQTVFMFHQDVLCFYSPYFRGALNGEFQEASTREIVIDDIGSNVMEAFSSWIYFHKLYEPKDPKSIKRDSATIEERTRVSLKFPILLDLWIFGDRMGVPAFQNAVIDAIHQRSSDCWNADILDQIKKIYARTTKGARLRAYVIDFMVFALRPTEVMDDRKFQVMARSWNFMPS